MNRIAVILLFLTTTSLAEDYLVTTTLTSVRVGKEVQDGGLQARSPGVDIKLGIRCPGSLESFFNRTLLGALDYETEAQEILPGETREFDPADRLPSHGSGLSLSRCPGQGWELILIEEGGLRNNHLAKASLGSIVREDASSHPDSFTGDLILPMTAIVVFHQQVVHAQVDEYHYTTTPARQDCGDDCRIQAEVQISWKRHP